ncbi:MAG: L-threonylcarbamoyladenylate synthase [Rhodoglobus sp.]
MSSEAVHKAATVLRNAGLVAFPTETVYGLGADASSDDAIGRMYSVKNRPANHPVIIHIVDSADVDYWAEAVPEFAQALMRDFWPGPMTLILPRSARAHDCVTGGQNSVGIRIPDHPLALELLREFRQLGGMGVAAPSANRYGAVSPTNASAVRSELQQYLAPSDMILDGGDCKVGVESTIIDCTSSNPVILRPGAISADMISGSTGLAVFEPESASPRVRVSGSHSKHYSPKARVVIGGSCATGEGLIAGAEFDTPSGVIRLAAPTTHEEYARLLYAALREADARGLSVVRIIPPSGDGVAIAIRDRITRSSADS